MMRWPSIPLREVASIDRKPIDPSRIKTATPYVGLENIESGGAFVKVRDVLSGELASAKFAFTPKHLLYGKLRPYLRKIARPDFSGICSTDILPILPTPRLDRGYLAWLLLTPQLIEFANARATGVNLPRLSPSVLAEIEVPLPPVSEQRRIAAILDTADSLRTKRRVALVQLDVLAHSIFIEMFGDPASNSKAFPVVKLGSLGVWQSGGTPSRDRSEYFEGNVPWFSSGELGQIVVSRSDEWISDRALQETSAKPVPRGALMLGMYDTAALKTSIAGVDCSCNQAIAFSKLDESRVLSQYAYFAITIGRSHFRRMQRGVRQRNLNLSIIRDTEIPLPSIQEQRTFLQRTQTIEAQKTKFLRFLTGFERLFACLQHHAFRGEL